MNRLPPSLSHTHTYTHQTPPPTTNPTMASTVRIVSLSLLLSLSVSHSLSLFLSLSLSLFLSVSLSLSDRHTHAHTHIHTSKHPAMSSPAGCEKDPQKALAVNCVRSLPICICINELCMYIYMPICVCVLFWEGRGGVNVYTYDDTCPPPLSNHPIPITTITTNINRNRQPAALLDALDAHAPDCLLIFLSTVRVCVDVCEMCGCGCGCCVWVFFWGGGS
jgi:hypothetical protein